MITILCEDCGLPIVGLHRGAGNGRGQRFVDRECWLIRERDKAIALLKQAQGMLAKWRHGVGEYEGERRWPADRDNNTDGFMAEVAAYLSGAGGTR